MLKAILFDIDDTLYDLSIPFKEAFREFFPGEKMDLEGAFLASRKYSDLIYDRSLSGEISIHLPPGKCVPGLWENHRRAHGAAVSECI